MLFWQAIWFLYFQSELSAAEAIVLYAIYDVATFTLEVPSGYASDRLGRKPTLLLAALSGAVGSAAIAFGGDFAWFALGQAALGTAAALASGADSAFLYESLKAKGDGHRIEDEELRAWRFSFSAFALSAVAGGALALLSFALPFGLTALAFAGAACIALAFTEPPHDLTEAGGTLEGLRASVSHPVLAWLFVLAMLMYGYSHIPFVFGQPFIRSALETIGIAESTALVSGLVTAAMMALSVATSWGAPRVKRALGLAGLLLMAFAMQIVLTGVLALTANALAIGLLFLRMVPDSLSKPFILARVQPLLRDGTRATYLSLQSMAGRALFSGSLFLAAGASSRVGEMSHDQMQPILTAYALVGLLALIGLALWSRRVAL
nr:MFS transporter [Palleronia pontilimi]